METPNETQILVMRVTADRTKAPYYSAEIDRGTAVALLEAGHSIELVLISQSAYRAIPADQEAAALLAKR